MRFSTLLCVTVNQLVVGVAFGLAAVVAVSATRVAADPTTPPPGPGWHGVDPREASQQNTEMQIC